MQALALKYRPKNFDELIGQEAVSKSLTHALQEGRISHAYLFSGLRGSGKTSSARIFSKALVCEQGPTSHPCEICSHCQMANESRHMDIIEMDAASHRKIDDIRELIEQTKYAPAAARYKIFIIDEVHMLTKEAFNALLKTLEEPPSYVKFILATTDPLKLPATVLSRTQHFRFKQISKHNIIKHLEFILSKEGISYEKEALEILARSGSGSLRDTLTLLDQAIIFSTNHITQTAVASMLGLLDPIKIEEILDVVILGDKDKLKELVLELEIYEPEMIIDELIINLKEKFLNNDPKFSLLIYERFFRILSQTKGMLSVSSDNGFILTIMLFMMIEALNLKTIDEAIVSLQTSKQTNQAQNLTQKSTTVINSNTPNLAQNDPYALFLSKIYDRDYELGECFKRCIEFQDFKQNTMYLSSGAMGEDQTKMRNSSKIIMQILRACFGNSANIKIVAKEQKPLNEPKNENSSLSYLDAELSNLNIDQNLSQTQPHPKPIEVKPIITPSINFNGQKSPEELERLKQEGVIKEANKLFGEPQIIKS
ncbi:DNA polymerase III subunit gamma/tau [Campylobacter sp. RM13119]|uniref:DNA polymerase III subunit gamma/tau n=1 Tax=Campylobacter TaxID=194 RepID=UPI0014741C09|nr:MULTISPECIES: DNA polymerase III subunit gamma/tau [unclassified Campylobacter]MBE3022516.1 DNA polymerase III subunit gamma/tau [Campylobacter sp. 7477a]MBE3606246.1 DNA polymerase III subunit gamma/tau [Campylobacter sp. RM13119]MBE3608922.1 DNA polymerase III subunit gamma/tau [Campylobacter sp. RM12916]